TVAKFSTIPTLEPSFTYNQRQNMENAYTLGIGFNIPLWINKKAAETKNPANEWDCHLSDYLHEDLSTPLRYYPAHCRY
ncbi:MAG: hypothetical protein AAB072_09485, partial [Nitrospirota bacterium]